MVRRLLLWVCGLVFLLGALNSLTFLFPPPRLARYPDAVAAAVREGAMAITVGHSHSRAIDFPALGIPGQHLFGSSADLLETQFLLPAYLHSIPTVRYVLIPLSPWDLFRNQAVAEPRHRQETYRLGRLIGARRIITGDLANRLSSWILAISGEDLWSYLHSESYILQGSWGLARDGNLGARPDPRGEVMAGVRTLMAHLMVTRERQPDLPIRVFETVMQIHRDLEEKGIRAVFYRSPLPTLTMQALEAEALKRGLDVLGAYERFLRDLEVQGVQVLDPFEGSTLANDLGLFDDFSHVNQDGATAFSTLLRGLLAKAPGGPF